VLGFRASEQPVGVFGPCVCSCHISLISAASCFIFFFFFFSFRFDFIFSFVPWSHSIFVPCGLFTLSEKTLAPFHLGAQGGCSQPRAAWRRVLCSVPRYGNMVTDRVQIPLFKSFSFFKGGGEAGGRRNKL